MCLTKLLPTLTSIWLNYVNSFWLLRNCIKTCFCMRKHIDISRTIINFFDALKTKDRKIRRNCNLLTKVKFHELEWSSLLSLYLCVDTQYVCVYWTYSPSLVEYCQFQSLLCCSCLSCSCSCFTQLVSSFSL